MTELSSLIFRVRSSLSDLPIDFAADHQIMEELIRARDYMTEILRSDVAEAYKEHCIVAYSVYLLYVNYTSAVEQRLGNIPPTSLIRVNVLRQVALNLIRPYAKTRMKDDLSPDSDYLERTRPISYGVTESVLENTDV